MLGRLNKKCKVSERGRHRHTPKQAPPRGSSSLCRSPHVCRFAVPRWETRVVVNSGINRSGRDHDNVRQLSNRIIIPSASSEVHTSCCCKQSAPRLPLGQSPRSRTSRVAGISKRRPRGSTAQSAQAGLLVQFHCAAFDHHKIATQTIRVTTRRQFTAPLTACTRASSGRGLRQCQQTR